MFNYTYEIAERRIQFCSEVPLQQDAWSVLFQTDKMLYETDIFCIIKLCKKLPDQQGKLLTQTLTMHLYREQDVLWQELLALSDGRVLARAQYSVHGRADNRRNEVRLYLAEIEQPWINRIAHIWAGMDLGYQLLWQDRLLLHSASVSTGQEIILFAGSSGIGKSTQAELWRKYRGAEILNGDKNVIGVVPDRSCAGTECRSVMVYGVPFCGTSSICHSFKKKLQSIVFLEQGEQNEVKQLRGREALTGLLENCIGHPGVAEATAKMLELAAEVVEQIPVFRLICRPEKEAVEILEQVLVKNIFRE